MEMRAYRIHHVARLLLKNEGQRVMKEYCNLQGETIPKYLSLSESLDHSLKEVNLIWEDWNRYKSLRGFVLQIMKNFTENKKIQLRRTKNPRKNPYFMFENAVSNEKIHGSASRIRKTVSTHYNYRHIHTLYS
jgi:hypothetical protein